jgi:hypothetical protein
MSQPGLEMIVTHHVTAAQLFRLRYSCVPLEPAMQAWLEYGRVYEILALSSCIYSFKGAGL